MWKSFECRFGTGRTGYMGFSDVYENTLSFLLEEPGRETRDYYQLVEGNFEIFTDRYTVVRKRMDRLASGVSANAVKSRSGSDRDTRAAIRLVEPRELLHMLNFVETNITRLHYAPRPFYRSNVFCLTSLLQTRDNTRVACMFCGKCSSYRRVEDQICFATVSEVEGDGATEATLRNYTFSVAEIGGLLFSNDLTPEQQVVCTKPLSENGERLHYVNCPIAWLNRDQNAIWNYKEATFLVRGVSKFHHMMQFLTVYPRPRENASWLCLMNRMSACHVPGASLHTLECLFRIIAHERLQTVVERFEAEEAAKTIAWVVHYSPQSRFTSPKGPPLHHYHEPMHVNQYVSEVVNLADNTVEFGDHAAPLQTGELVSHQNLPFGGSHAVLTPSREHTVAVRANSIGAYTTAHRPFDLTPAASSEFTSETAVKDLVGAFTDNTVTNLDYYRLLFLHGFLVRPLETFHRPFVIDSHTAVDRTESHVCLYCGVIFPNALIHYDNAVRYYSAVQTDVIIRYAIAGANDKLMHRVSYGRHLTPVKRFQATFPGDLTPRVLPRKVKTNERLRNALVWLSASMDSLHTDECLFRMKRRSFVANECCVCRSESSENKHVAMSCGHELCTSCYNEISITDCCICRRGYRTKHMTVSDSVVFGYLQRRTTGTLV